MKYEFCSIRVNVTKYDVTFATKEVFQPPPSPRGFATAVNTSLAQANKFRESF